jgi:hypothetical protein
MLPYVSKAERERAQWMTLVEVVNHVQLSQRCDQAAALSQLRMALADQEVPVRWKADPRPQGIFHIGPAPIFSVDQVSTDASYWIQTLIFLDGDGRVIDQPPFQYLEAEGELPPPQRLGRPRPLLLLRSRVLELWQMPSDTAPDSEQAEPPKLSRRKREDAEIQQAAREVYRGAPEDPPNMDEAGREICQRLPGADRDAVRKVLKEEEFAKLRRPSGNQPKHGRSTGNPPND